MRKIPIQIDRMNYLLALITLGFLLCACVSPSVDAGLPTNTAAPGVHPSVTLEPNKTESKTPVSNPISTTTTNPANTTPKAQPSTPTNSSSSSTTKVTQTIDVTPSVRITNHPLKYRSLVSKGISMHILTFDSSQYELKVADQQPGQKWTSAKAAMTSLKGVAAINAGFFDPNGKPLGYVRSNNSPAGAWNTSSSLTSGVYQLSNGVSSLKRNNVADRRAKELVQTGPFLLENSATVKGLSTKNSALRSLLLWDGGNHFAIVHTSSCTLANLSSALKALPSTLPKKFALNLDGGRSCDFHVSAQAHSSPIQRGHWLRNQVRNYLVVVKK